jgi:hypothetical protein
MTKSIRRERHHKGLELTASSVRWCLALASSSSSGAALAVKEHDV